jgi:hypothetical protein
MIMTVGLRPGVIEPKLLSGSVSSFDQLRLREVIMLIGIAAASWPVCTENLDTDVVVMKSAKDRV